MILRHMIDIDETLKLTQGQGQRSRSLPAGKHFWEYENVHLYQTGATDIFTRRKCPCLYIPPYDVTFRVSDPLERRLRLGPAPHYFSILPSFTYFLASSFVMMCYERFNFVCIQFRDGYMLGGWSTRLCM